ncbi:MAG: hypothetical protein MPN21_27835, partial [Thermoanaerobaculia bacterium]|nr:hypothetical protein [Thermoanaerobaculia bacterium]
MRAPLSLVFSVLLLSLLASLATAEPAARKAPEGSTGVPATVKPASGVAVAAIGTITYDNNVPFQRDGQVNGMVGNRF